MIAASIQMHIRGLRNLNNEATALFFKLYEELTTNVLGRNEQNSDSRWLVFRKALLSLNPFPRCSTAGCGCFGRLLTHEHQNVSSSWSLEKTGCADK